MNIQTSYYEKTKSVPQNVLKKLQESLTNKYWDILVKLVFVNNRSDAKKKIIENLNVGQFNAMQRTGERFDVSSRDRIDVAWNLKEKRKFKL
jgi:hypothetical protein